MSNADQNQTTVIFEGKVQGVGFRATACAYAKELGLVGSAHNLPDGSVQVIVQGNKDQCEALIEKLKDRFTIKKTTINISSEKELSTDFLVF